jgi:hypothetical protein
MILLLFTACAHHPTPPIPLAAGPRSADEPAYRVVLTGDGGDERPTWMSASCEGCADGVRDAMRAELALPGSELLWLGDNVYFFGVGREEGQRARRILGRQVEVAPMADQVWFVPGNHDWNQAPRWSRRRGAREARMITSLGAHPAAYPTHGVGDGVVQTRDVDGLRIVYVDSERVIKLPRLREEALTEIATAVAGASGPLLVTMHHPLESVGPHGRAIWSPWACVGGDMGCPGYTRWAGELGETLAAATGPVLVAGGHEHELEVVRVTLGEHAATQIVSGSSAEAHCVPSAADLRFDATLRAPGFVVLDVYADRYELRVAELIAPDEAGCHKLRPGTRTELVWGDAR